MDFVDLWIHLHCFLCIYDILNHTNLRGKVILLLQLFPQTVTEQEVFWMALFLAVVMEQKLRFCYNLPKQKYSTGQFYTNCFTSLI